MPKTGIDIQKLVKSSRPKTSAEEPVTIATARHNKAEELASAYKESGVSQKSKKRKQYERESAAEIAQTTLKMAKSPYEKGEIGVKELASYAYDAAFTAKMAEKKGGHFGTVAAGSTAAAASTGEPLLILVVLEFLLEILTLRFLRKEKEEKSEADKAGKEASKNILQNPPPQAHKTLSRLSESSPALEETAKGTHSYSNTQLTQSAQNNHIPPSPQKQHPGIGTR